MKLLTNSSQKSYRACPRLYKYTYVDGYRANRDSDALTFGTLMHKMLEAGAVTPPDGEKPFEYAKACALMTGYLARWAPMDMVAVEIPFRTPIINPDTCSASRTFERAGKIDGICRDPNGQHWLVENKTTSEDISPGSEYWRRLRMDSQVSTYYDGAYAALGFDVWGCIYNVIKKPALRPLKANTRRGIDETPDEYRDRIIADIAADPDKYYQRAEVVRLEKEMDDHKFDTWQIASMIRESENSDRWPRNPDACSRYGRTCEFFDVCTGTASLDDRVLFTKKEDPYDYHGVVKK